MLFPEQSNWIEDFTNEFKSKLQEGIDKAMKGERIAKYNAQNYLLALIDIVIPDEWSQLNIAHLLASSNYSLLINKNRLYRSNTTLKEFLLDLTSDFNGDELEAFNKLVEKYRDDLIIIK